MDGTYNQHHLGLVLDIADRAREERNRDQGQRALAQVGTTVSCAPMAFVAVITGASSGIGEAAARRLAREPDARLVLVARREDRLRALASELGGATVVAVDLLQDGAPERVREMVEREHGQLHLLVNNAGGSWRGPFGDVCW